MTASNPTQQAEPVAAVQQPKAVLLLTKECKHSARFDACDPLSQMVIRTVYLDKQAWLILDKAAKILITVEKK